MPANTNTSTLPIGYLNSEALGRQETFTVVTVVDGKEVRAAFEEREN